MFVPRKQRAGESHKQRSVRVRTGALFVGLVATGFALTGCGQTGSGADESGGAGVDDGQSAAAQQICSLGRAALQSFQDEGLSPGTYSAVESLISSAVAGSEETVLLYYVWDVGDAHRGSSPELTLGPTLRTVVEDCAQRGL